MTFALFLFEVMDKEDPLWFIWTFCIAIAIGGFLLVRFSPLFLPLVLVVLFLIASLPVMEINDEFVGQAIIHEAGYGYVIQIYLAVGIAIIMPFVGLVAWWQRRKAQIR